MKVIMPWGRSFDGVLADVRQHFGNVPVLAVTLPTDQPAPIEGVEFRTTEELSKDNLIVADGDVVVLNGGTTNQQWCITRQLIEFATHLGWCDAHRHEAGLGPLSETNRTPVRFVNVQRDGLVELGNV